MQVTSEHLIDYMWSCRTGCSAHLNSSSHPTPCPFYSIQINNCSMCPPPGPDVDGESRPKGGA
ncbi:hypothetical protein AOLI_G00031120 [Acnodon oligacanthus]